MKKEINPKTLKLDHETERQINQWIHLVKEFFGQDLPGVFLDGSSTLGGLQKYSDIDLLVVSNQSTTHEEQTKLTTRLFQIFGVYMKRKAQNYQLKW